MAFGFHVAKSSKVRDKSFSTYLQAIKEETTDFGTNLAQIFTHGPRTYSENKMDYKAIKTYCHQNNITLICHSSYMSNALWNKVADKTAKGHASMLGHLKAQMEACAKLGIEQFVLHLPKGTNEHILECMKVLGKIKPPSVILSLEMKPLKPHANTTQETPEKINALCETLQTLEYKEWNICVDTAHLWGAGVELTKKPDMRKWLAGLKYPERIGLLHINGSFATKGSFKDKHAIAFSNEDLIWGKAIKEELVDYYQTDPDIAIDKAMPSIKTTGIYELFKFAKSNNIPIVFEINRGKTKYTKFLLGVFKSV